MDEAKIGMNMRAIIIALCLLTIQLSAKAQSVYYSNYGNEYKVAIVSFTYEYPEVPTVLIPTNKLIPIAPVPANPIASATVANQAIIPQQVMPAVVDQTARHNSVIYLQPALYYAVPSYQPYAVPSYQPVALPVVRKRPVTKH